MDDKLEEYLEFAKNIAKYAGKIMEQIIKVIKL